MDNFSNSDNIYGKYAGSKLFFAMYSECLEICEKRQKLSHKKKLDDLSIEEEKQRLKFKKIISYILVFIIIALSVAFFITLVVNNFKIDSSSLIAYIGGTLVSFICLFVNSFCKSKSTSYNKKKHYSISEVILKYIESKYKDDK